MSLFLDAMKFGNRNKTYYEKVKEIYMDIELNNKANEIIEKYPINISVFFRLNEKRQEFSIFKEMNKKNQSNIQYKKPTKRNIKAFSPIEKSISNHKRT